ncbi:MAG: hypothetical protein J2P27_08110, partial [Actinobacteria bacterium]|nr:hypothetical protein [Actinomycetota bacterium]
ATAAGPAAERDVRSLAGQITVTLQAALMARHAPAAVADAFVATRLNPEGYSPAMPFGSLPSGLDLPAILARAYVAPADGKPAGGKPAAADSATDSVSASSGKPESVVTGR